MPRPSRSLRFLPLLLALSTTSAARGHDGEKAEVGPVEAQYDKYEHRIPMRDGVRLFTAVYVPKDRSRRYPILIERTPYGVGPYGAGHYPDELGPSAPLRKSGYIFVHQDVRGCFLSGGRFVDVRPQVSRKQGPRDVDESTDAFDTIDWLVEHVPDNNGKVGMWGISYPGFYAAAGAIDAHPALKAVSPQAPLVDWFLGDDTHHNGALFLQQEFNFDAEFGLPREAPTTKEPAPFDHGTRDAYAFFLELGPLTRVNDLYFKDKHPFWNEVMAHGVYDDFWKARDIRPHLREIRPAVLTVGGWYDAEDLFGTLQTYQTIERTSKSENLLVMGPWIHGGWSTGDGESIGAVRFGSKPSATYRERVEFPFFEHHLKGRGGWDPPEAWVFETGRDRWHAHDSWPPREAEPRSLYLRAGGRLAFEPPSSPAPPEFDEYTSDPAHPVPYTTTRSIHYPPSFMVEDQRFASRRADVLTYQTDVLSRDVTVAGPIAAELVVSTSGTDADWVVKLIDVHSVDRSATDPDGRADRPGGPQRLVRGDVMRGKFRKSFATPEPFAPGEPTVVPFALQDVYHTFRAGHRIMVQVQSTWFPLVDRNPQTFVDIYHARASDFRKATHRVYHSPGRASRLGLRVLP